MANNDRLWELLARQQSGMLLPSEQAELQSLLADDAITADRQHLLGQISLKSEVTLPPEDKERLLDGIMGRIHETSRPAVLPTASRWGKRLIAAVAFLVCAVAGVWSYFRFVGHAIPQEKWHTIVTPAGSISRLTLPDGTFVVLNAGSTLSYPEPFNEKKRVLRLSGEGFFNVAKAAGAPLVIYTHTMEVRVLGTTFNIKAYPGDGQTETALLSGKVMIIPNGRQENPITLRPHQKVSVRTTAQSDNGKVSAGDQVADTLPVVLASLVTNEQDHTIQETAWMDNRLVYNNEKFPLLMKRIERWYGITIICRNKALLASSFTGNVKQESLERLFKLLQQTQYFEYEITDKQVLIY